MRSSAAQPHFQRSATKLPRAASEVAQRRGALPRPQSACNLGRACTEGAPSRRPLLSPSTEGASSKGVDTIYPLTSRRRPLKERELALIGELAVSQSVPSISPRTLFGPEFSVPRWEEEGTGSECSAPKGWEGPEARRRLQLTTQLTAIGITGSSHGEAKRDDMARGEARGLAAALLEEIRAGAEDPLTTPLTLGALPGELQLSLARPHRAAAVTGCRHACNHACRPVSAPPSRTARAADLVRRRQAAAGAFEREHKRRGLAGVKAALALHDEGERGACASTNPNQV